MKQGLLLTFLLFIGTVLSESCEYSYKQYPKGFANPSGSDSVSLSNIWAESDFILGGGMQQAQELLSTSESKKNSDGIPFLFKQSLQGQNMWVQFYSNEMAKKVVNVAYSSAEEKVIVQFSAGVFAQANQEGGDLEAAIQIDGIADSDGDSWAKHGATLTSDGSSVIFMSGLQIEGSTNYRFEMFKLSTEDLSVGKHIYLGNSLSSYGHFGPAGICNLDTSNRFAVVGSVQSDTSHPVGVLMVLDENLGFVSQTQGIWKMDDSEFYVKPTAVRCSGDDFYVGHNVSPKTGSSYPDMETGTGELASIRKFSWVEATPEVTMEDWEIAVSTSSEDVCDTFEIGDEFIYWFCTITAETEGTMNPFILITTFPGNVYEDAIFLNWGQSLTASTDVDDRIKVHTSAIKNGQLFFGGSALQIIDSARDRFTFISNFIEEDKKSGCHIQITALTNAVDLSGHLQVEQDLVYDNFVLWTDLTQTDVSATISELNTVEDFSVYPLALEYEQDSTAQICGSELEDQTTLRQEIWRSDEATYSFELSFPQERTFDVDSSTCDEDAPTIVLPDGTELDDSSSPFSFDGSELSFSSDSEDYVGIYEFPTMNLEVIVLQADETWTPDHTDLITSFDGYRDAQIEASRSLNIETQAVWTKSGISTGLSSFSGKSVFYANYKEQARDFYYPKSKGTLPPQFTQVAPNEPPFFNVVEDTSAESIMIGTSFLYTPPWISDDSPYQFQDLQVTKGSTTKSVLDPAFESYFPNIDVQKRTLQVLPKLMIKAVDLTPLTISWNWAEMETTNLYSATDSFSLSFFNPPLTEEEIREIAYNNFMKDHIKDFEITDNEFLKLNITADSLYGEIILEFSSDFSMPFNTIDDLQEARFTIRFNGEIAVQKLERMDEDKIVFTLEFEDLYTVSEEDTISVQVHQLDTFVSKTSGLTFDPNYTYLEANLVQQLSDRRYLQIKEDAKMTIRVVFIIVLAASIGTSWLSNLFSMISLAQLISLMPLVELNYPLSTKLYFEGIQGINLQFMGFQDQLTGLTFSGSGGGTEEKFQMIGFKTHAFILNTADLWLICLLMFGKYLVVKFLVSVYQDNKKKRDMLKKEEDKFKGQVQFELVQIGYMVILLSAYLNIQELNQASVLEWISSAFSIIFMALLLFLPVFYSVLTQRIYKLNLDEDRDFMRVFGALYLDLDFRRRSSLAFGPTTMFMRLLFLVVILFIPEAPEVQLSICMFIQMTLFAILVCTKPYKSTMRNIREGFILVFAICLLGMLWSFSYGKDFDDKKQGQDLFLAGSIVLFFISVLLFVFDMFISYCLSRLCNWYNSDEEEAIAIKPKLEDDIFAYLEQDTQEIPKNEEQESKRKLNHFPRYEKGLHENIDVVASPMPYKMQDSNLSSSLGPESKQLQPKTLTMGPMNHMVPPSQKTVPQYRKQVTNNVKVMDDTHPEENSFAQLFPDDTRDSALQRELERISRMEKKKSAIRDELNRRQSVRQQIQQHKRSSTFYQKPNEKPLKIDEEPQVEILAKKQGTQKEKELSIKDDSEEDKEGQEEESYEEEMEEEMEEEDDDDFGEEKEDDEEGKESEYQEEEEQEMDEFGEDEEEGELDDEENDEEFGEEEEEGEYDQIDETEKEYQKTEEAEKERETIQKEGDSDKSDEVHVKEEEEQVVPQKELKNVFKKQPTIQLNKPRQLSETKKWANQPNRDASSQQPKPLRAPSPKKSDPQAPVTAVSNPQSLTARGPPPKQEFQPKTPGVNNSKNGLQSQVLQETRSPLAEDKKVKKIQKPVEIKKEQYLVLSSKQIDVKGSIRNQTLSPQNRPPPPIKKRGSQASNQKRQPASQSTQRAKKTVKNMSQAYGKGKSKLGSLKSVSSPKDGQRKKKTSKISNNQKEEEDHQQVA